MLQQLQHIRSKLTMFIDTTVPSSVKDEQHHLHHQRKNKTTTTSETQTLRTIMATNSTTFAGGVESMKKIHILEPNQLSHGEELTTSPSTTENDDEEEDQEGIPTSSTKTRSTTSNKTKQKHSYKIKKEDFADHYASKVFTRELHNKKRRHNFTLGHFHDDLENILTTVITHHDKEEKKKSNIEDEPTIDENETQTCCVNFSVVTIQEYSIEPGDNPGGNKGCPLTIGWDPVSEPVTFDLDAYEEVRHFNRRLPREMELVSAHRQDLLLRMGYSAHEIIAATREANNIRRNRYKTIDSLKSTESQERIEGLRKKLHNLMTFGGAKRQERNFLAPYYKKTQNV